MHYRPEIDGLRAVAVVPVILFHAGFNIFSGGFVGVDIFFVISGFLITTILLAEIEAGTFSLATFYERRARRILPALFFVLAVCLPAAWLWLLPQEMKSFSNSLIAVAGFCSNILFWKTSGYFEAAAELKPLLHTWSLAVEEQYYLFFPLFLMFAWRLGRRFMLTVLVIGAVGSLAIAQWGALVTPEAAFYLLPTRAWELAIGSFVAFYFSHEGRRGFSDLSNQVISAIGFSLILVSLFLFDRHTSFPSVYTLLPTVGTACIILCATQSTITGRLLSNRVFVGIGLISYSAYLWHQPLLAFAKHQSFDEPGRVLCAILVVASLVLGYLSWRFVEKPFRNRSTFNRRQIFSLSAVGSVLVIAAGFAGKLDDGHQSRLSAESRAYLSYFDNSYPEWRYFKRENWYRNFWIDCDFYDIGKEWSGAPTRVRKQIAPECYTRDPGKKHVLLIWGDSHAQHFYAGLKRNLPSDWQIMQVASSGCRPSLQYDEKSNNYCKYSNYFAHKTIMSVKPDVVLLGQESGHRLAHMDEIGKRLEQDGVKLPLFAGPSPHWRKGGLPSVIAFNFLTETPRYSSLGLERAVQEADHHLKQGFPRNGKAQYLSQFDYFCTSEGCLLYYGNDNKAGVSSYDNGHLATIASEGLAKAVLVPVMMEAVAARP